MMPRIETLKKLIAEAEKYLDDPDKGKRKAAEEIIGVLELRLNDRVGTRGEMGVDKQCELC